MSIVARFVYGIKRQWHFINKAFAYKSLLAFVVLSFSGYFIWERIGLAATEGVIQYFDFQAFLSGLFSADMQLNPI